MLTLERCRELLGDDAPQSDADLETLRDQLYGLARVVAESCPHHQGHGKALQNTPDAAQRVINGAVKDTSGFLEALAMLPEDDRYDVEERTAIMEFDGRLDRDAAELAVFSLYWREKHS